MKLSDLKKPFPADDIEWRIAQCGLKQDEKPWAKALAYITSRAVHDRLDEVCGPENWQMEYLEFTKGAVCRIGIKVGSEWVWKCGGSDETDFEAFKGMLSTAEKRAGVPWGIGRYLYNLSENWVECTISAPTNPGSWQKQKGKDKSGQDFWFWWQVPQLPAWALPKGKAEKPSSQPPKQEPLISEEQALDIVFATGGKDMGDGWQKKMTDFYSKADGKEYKDMTDIPAKHFDEIIEIIKAKPIKTSGK
jgi:hypothetical protein